MSTLPTKGSQPSPRSAENRADEALNRPQAVGPPSPAWSDAELIEACLDGRQSAWDAFVQKYQRYVYSIIVRSGTAERGEEEDLFQNVWIDVYNHLQDLRRQGSLRSWLAAITRHRCYHWRVRARRLPEELDEAWASTIPDQAEPPQEVIERLERDQEIREAVLSLRPRCRRLLARLFLEDPPRPYAEVARELGLAEGSIGSLRARCLVRLKRELEKRGVLPVRSS